jgi:hypothetical protein
VKEDARKAEEAARLAREKEKNDRAALVAKQKYLEDLSRSIAEGARMAAVSKAVDGMLGADEFEQALAQLDAVRDDVTTERSKKRLDELVAKVRAAYGESRAAAERKRGAVFAEQRVSFDAALTADDLDKARRVLSLLKTVYGDLAGAKQDIAQAEIALRAAEKRIHDTEMSKRFMAALSSFESMFAADDLAGARAVLKTLKTDFSGRADYRPLDARVAARDKQRQKERAEEDAKHFEQGVKDVGFFISQDNFLKAKIELENLKNLYVANRAQAKRLADLEARIKHAAHAYEKTVIAKQFDDDIAAVRAALASDDFTLARITVEKMRSAYTDRRSEIEDLDTAIRDKESLRRGDAMRKRDARFVELGTDLEYFIKKEQFDQAESTLTKLTAQFAEDRSYADRIDAYARRFAAQRGSYLTKAVEERYTVGKNDAEYLMRMKDYRKAKERLLELGNEFPHRDEIETLLVAVERAMIEERTQQKEHIRQQVQEVRSRNDSNDVRAFDVARAALSLRLADAKVRVDAAVARDDFAAAYAVVDTLTTGLDDRLKSAVEPLEADLRVAESAYVARSKAKRMQDADERFRAFDAALAARSYFRAEALLDGLQADYGIDPGCAPRVEKARARLRKAQDQKIRKESNRSATAQKKG